MSIRFTPEAASDLRAIHTYIAKHNDRAADRVIARIRQSIMIFERFPMLGREGRVAGTREFAIPGLPYTVVYRIVSDTDLDILTILHQRLKYPPD
ncbi:toxin ParE1/3/4 [Caulobacter ginsengisoli]|uniref:Toxin ParE1/3/4 n=1 Tax=Caulobacter ginsengisoli TaxID=400775 RepID=A0ABU0IV36_9CAUL|nr:type II toxin-antitoxin system RelE/ParE family toxin [Caulobacter ginsengisoli]MDQ0465877.1 toxin ParE1/3/4 [Caulobacter ginsengisoli]